MLKFSKDLQLFLEASEEEWSLEVSRAIAEANAQKPKFSGMAQIFKGLQHSTANLVAGRTDDEDEDPEYLKVWRCGVSMCGWGHDGGMPP